MSKWRARFEFVLNIDWLIIDPSGSAFEVRWLQGRLTSVVRGGYRWLSTAESAMSEFAESGDGTHKNDKISPGDADRLDV